MAVTYVFSPSTTIFSGQVNTNNTDITSGAALNGFSNDVYWNNEKRAIFKNNSGGDGLTIYANSANSLIFSSRTAGNSFIFRKSDASDVVQIDTSTHLLKALGIGTTHYAAINQQGLSFGQLITSAGDIYLGTSADGEVVILGRTPRRNHSANTYINAAVQFGWGYIQGNNSIFLTANVSFPVAFSSVIAVPIPTHIGSRATSAGVPTGESWFTSSSDGYCQIRNITASGFILELRNPFGVNFSSSDYYGYAWIAIGQI